jgi:hypothetical protein
VVAGEEGGTGVVAVYEEEDDGADDGDGCRRG